MPKDIIITPDTALIDFKNSSNVTTGSIQLDDIGNLNVTSPGGNVVLGNPNTDIYIGDGTNNIDLVFEQDGEIRGLTGRTITFGQADSYVSFGAPIFGNTTYAAGGTDSSKNITLRGSSATNGTLSWEGSEGQLFSITNNLSSGSIYSVNDISGIPVLDINADGTVSIGAYYGNVGIGTELPSTKLDVVGSIKGNSVVVASDSSSDALRITQTGTGNPLVVEDSTNPDSTPVVINSTGRVGIGTTDLTNTRYSSAFTQLVVSGDASSLRQGMTIDGYTNPGIAFQGRFTDAENDIKGLLIYNPFNSSGDITLDDSQQITGRGFSIAPSETTVVAITSSVLATSSNIDVGIGTAVPTAKLDVVGDLRVGRSQSEGLILTSPDGTRYRLVVSNTGVLSASVV